MSSFFGDTARVGVSKVLMIVLGIATAAISARWLGPSISGVLAAVTVYPTLLMTVGSLGVRQATAFSIGSGKHSLDEVKTAIAQLWVVSTFVTMLASYLLLWCFNRHGSDLLLVSLAVAPVPFVMFNTYNTGIFLGQNKIRLFSRVSWLPTLFVFIAMILLVVIWNFGVYGALLAAALGPCVMFVVLMTQNHFLQHISVKVNWTIIRSLVGLGSIYAIALLVLDLNYKADVIFLDYMTEPRELGIYSKGAKMMQYLWQVPMLFGVVTFARSASATDHFVFSQKVTKLLRFSLIVVGAGALVLAVLAEPLMLFLFGAEFHDSAEVLQILVPGVVVLTIFKVVNMDLAGRGKPWIAIYAMLPALIVNLALNFVLIPRYGANGAAFASTVSYIMGGTFAWIAYARETGLPLTEILKFGIDDIYFLLSRAKFKPSLRNRSADPASQPDRS